MAEKPRVLVIAEAANPEWVSVPLVGWSLAIALGQVADTHIVTQIRNREAFLRAGLVEGQDFTTIDSERLAAPMWRMAEKLRMGKGVGWTMTTAISSLSYGYFERLVWRQFGPRLKAGEFDLVHRVTPLTPTANSLIAPRCRAIGLPFLLGPLNGGVPWPRAFDAERRREKEYLSYVRGLYRLRPGRGRMLKAASAIICGSLYTMQEVPRSCIKRAVYLPENAVDPLRFDLTAQRPEAMRDGILRACFIGRLVPYKGADMGIEAAAPMLRAGRMIYDIIGDGPQIEDLRQMAVALGVADRVIFHGWQDHGAVQAIAGQADILLFPSIREFGGGVVLEAMAMGVVPVIADYAGPGELVDESTGIRVPMGPRDALVAGFRAALQQMLAD
ncbi:MAG: glycosyltransferase family 4 protein, partial [Paracoccus sp. (in: a-proteobacteria)]